MRTQIRVACFSLLLIAPIRVLPQEGSDVGPKPAAAAKTDVGQSAAQPSAPSLKPNPLEVLRDFEAAPDEDYRLGKGDEISIDFPGRSDMQAKLVVGPDGRIALPPAGEIMLAGLTRSEAAKAVQSALSSYYANLDAQVSVTRYTANRVLLLGAVEHPGTLTFDGTPTLLEAITRAGVETGPNKISQVPERCAIYRGNDQVVWVELRALLESGNPLVSLRLRRDDVVYVPSQSERIVSVLGEVQHPGAIPLNHNSTLASIVAEAGGFTERAGNTPHIQIVDPADGTSRVFTLKDILDPAKTLEATLKPGEIIFVPRTGFNKATYVLERLNPLISVAMMAFYTGAL